MSEVVEKLKAVPNLFHLSGCITSQIKEAQNTLNLEFPDEYIDYVKTFGAVSFYGTEWKGLNVDGDLNVVNSTMQERQLDSNFPNDCFVIENIGIDGVLALMDQNGKIYYYRRGNKSLLCDSLCEYLDICISRRSRKK